MVVLDEMQTCICPVDAIALPLTISCSSKSRLVLPFWYLLTRLVPDIFQKSSKMVVCVCVVTLLVFMFVCNEHEHMQ